MEDTCAMFLSNQIEVHLNGELAKTLTSLPPPAPDSAAPQPQGTGDADSQNQPQLDTGSHSYRLEQLALLRSGDKGDSANIGMVPESLY